MNIFKTIFTTLVIAVILSSCGNDYNRQEGCHLDQMKIKGDVLKVETIVQSSMPLTELYFNSFNPTSGVSCYTGNIAILFDNHGNIKRHIGYDMNGEELFSVQLDTTERLNLTPFVPIGSCANQTIDNVKTISDYDGKVVEVKYFDRNNLIWTQKANYNKDGTINSITKKYESLSIQTELINIEYSDTTSFHYLSFDDRNNWTEVEVNYRGILPRHEHSYKIKRQITYALEAEKPKLINELKAYNKVTDHLKNEFDRISLGDYGSMTIPRYMALQSKNYMKEVGRFSQSKYQSNINYIFMSVYDNKDAYATFSVNITPGNGSAYFDDLSPEELAYDEYTDKYLEKQYVNILAQGGIYVLKWLPYSYCKISGHYALSLQYYRYGKGSPIPVYCENYMLPMPDGNTLNFMYSFQSNLDYKFRSDFNNSIRSIVLNW